MLKNRLMTIVMAVTLFMGTAGSALAMIGEPDVVYYGTATTAASGSSVTVTLDGSVTSVASYNVGSDLKYVLRVPMDSVGARVPGTARTGDAATIAINGVLAAKVIIPARGTLVNLDLAKRDASQWAADHPGDDGSGDMNRNGISDLTEYLDGNDPASCVWTDGDAGLVVTTVYHQQVLKSCLAEAGADLKDNVIRVARGTYPGNFSYTSAGGEDFDLTLIGGYDPAGGAERSADPALTILNGDTDNDGTGNGVTLVVDTDNGRSTGKVRIESFTVKNGAAPAGEKGGGLQARIYQGDLELVGNIISGNRADSGGGLSVDSSDSAPIFLTNNIIYGNSAATAAAVRIVSGAAGPVTLLNNSIANNTATTNGDGRSLLIEGTTVTVDVTNNIIFASTGVSGSDIYINSSGVTIPLTVSHNAYDAVNGLFTNSPGFIDDANAIVTSPQFLNPSAGNYRLAPLSPGIDVGIAHARLPGKDADGVSRISGVGVDLGAYEFPQTVASITLGNLVQSYDGTAKSATATTDPPDKSVTYTYNGSATAPVNAGSYAVVATISDNNYHGSASDTLVISKGAATIALGSLTATYDGTAKAATATTSPPGKTVTFTYDGFATAPVNVGSYAVVATISDVNYQGSVSGTLIIIDTIAPTLSISSLADGAITNNSTLNVAGTVSDSGSGVKSVSVNGAATTVIAGSFSRAITLVDGENVIVTVVTDNADNQASDSRTVILDRTAPLLTVTTPADNSAIATGQVTITGTCGDATNVTISVNAGAAQLADITTVPGSYTLTVLLSGGQNTLTVTASDTTTNSAAVVRTLTYDTTAPTVAITLPATDSTVHSMPFTISGSVEDALTEVSLTMTVNGESVIPTIDGAHFTYHLVPLQGGTYQIVVIAKDLVENSSIATRNIIYQPYGDVTGDGYTTSADALLVLQMAIGTVAVDLTADVAPLVGGVPQPDGKVTAADALVILRKAVGLW